MIKILIIEDEIRLADVLYDWFYNKNFQVTVCHDGISGYETACCTYGFVWSDGCNSFWKDEAILWRKSLIEKPNNKQYK